MWGLYKTLFGRDTEQNKHRGAKTTYISIYFPCYFTEVCFYWINTI